MSLSCVIVDDEYLAIEIIKDYASRMQNLTIKNTFTNPQEALNYLSSNTVDILFLDIQMPDINGFELLKKLKNPPMVIFTTARHDYAVLAFELDVLDYLVKPIPFERFEKAVLRAKEYAAFKQPKQEEPIDYLMIKADHRIHKILFKQIDYIEGLSEYVKIHTAEKTIIPLASLKDLLDQLPAGQFIRAHKSFIVSLSAIQSYNHQSIILKSKKVVPIGRLYKQEFLQKVAGI